jgi:hypothetical protein
MGFEIKKGDKKVDDIDVHSNYNGVEQDRVLFVKTL